MASLILKPLFAFAPLLKPICLVSTLTFQSA
ncbi:hypothetical protein Ahy_A01g002836 isoform E [Arachis hypogaea]|uniref:Uncharacterized protein n=1 Tax=Arachis hypogaea TaxID=3818 RepID=A0A445ERI7_ARAHY|nr:hypothetical protein Ahy_A01g002836 isoform E [Arachis hypogaea]